jgi:hypothetical protein
VEDLAVASPATVSRCGMVYLEPGALGLEPLFASWLGRLPPAAAPHRELMGAMLRALVPPCLSYVSAGCLNHWLRGPACSAAGGQGEPGEGHALVRAQPVVRAALCPP